MKTRKQAIESLKKREPIEPNQHCEDPIQEEMKRPAMSEKCGCEIKDGGMVYEKIVYCAIHAHAEELLAALKMALEAEESLAAKVSRTDRILIMKQAIAKSTPRGSK